MWKAAEGFLAGIVSDGFVNHVHTQYVYPDAQLAVSCVSGGIAATGLQFVQGFELYLEQATLVYAPGTIGGQWHADRPLTLITNNGKAVTPKLKGDGNGPVPLRPSCRRRWTPCGTERNLPVERRPGPRCPGALLC